MSIELTITNTLQRSNDFQAVEDAIAAIDTEHVRLTGNTMLIGVLNSEQKLFCLIKTVGMFDYMAVVHSLVSNGYADTHLSGDIQGENLDLLFCPGLSAHRWVN